jgi:hypothetical protein
MRDLAAAIAPRIAFGLFGTNNPGVGNLGQHRAIVLRSGTRQPTALGRVVAKFFGIRAIVVVNINFHCEFHIRIDSSV